MCECLFGSLSAHRLILSMASIGWALMFFLAQFHLQLAVSSSHHAYGGNRTNLPAAPFLCHPNQAKALLQLKKSFSFGTSTTSRLPSWRHGTDCCLWEGVGCDTSSGNVTVLDLNNRGLSSNGLDPSIFSLTSLRRLDLSMNNFAGYRPDNSMWSDNIHAVGFERLALLTHLNLSMSGLHSQIPMGISKLVNLISLDLSSSVDYNYDYLGIVGVAKSLGRFEYPHKSNFNTLLANLSNLKELYLDGLDLSSTEEEWCMYLAKSVPQLQVLSLSSCSLSGPIHKSLLNLNSLSVINLEGNDFPDSPFPEFFMDFKNLSVLNLCAINLEGRFPSKPFKSKNLRVLDLSDNDLSGNLPNLPAASSLETLILAWTNFSSAKPTSSANLKLLKELGIGGSSLGIGGNSLSVDFLSSLGNLGSLCQLQLMLDSVSELGSIFSWIGDHKNLTSLTLVECNFSMTAPSLVSNFKTLRSLTMLDCYIPRSIFSAIGNLMDLQTLDMNGCTIYGSVPSSISNLTNLRNMYMVDCVFSGQMPAAIGSLTNLEILETSNSQFSGTIPQAIGQLKQLTWLDLSGCNFSGRIPSSIVNLTHLTGLHLSHNSLIGEIPSSIFTLPVLYDLDISENQISGPIQEFDEAPSHLESVDLSNNEFSGPIPKAFFQLTNLISLDISSNNFTGLVDLASFWKLRNLASLHLSNNQLSVMDAEGNSPLSTNELGLASCNITQFPRSLTHMNYISHLDLSYNNISGDVPNSLWKTWSSTLTYLDLSHNMLTGILLDVLPFTTPLDVFDLSYNRFQGRIPMPDASAVILEYSNNRFSSFLPDLTSYLTYTTYLSMSKNNISGHMPISICNSRMEYLDLSYNNFSGSIPSCIIESTELVVLNLRENNFEGMLPSNITTGCLLKMIDLHGNNIEGQLPRGLSNCTSLWIMDLGGNRIVDTYPSWLSGMSALYVIVLRSNLFYGAIGEIVGDKKSVESFSSLQVIDLASNNFSGKLNSHWFKKLEMMMLNYSGSQEPGRPCILFPSEADTFYDGYFDTMYKGSYVAFRGSYVAFERIVETLTTVIDLSNNRLEGTIPESIGGLVLLGFLNMSHNAFTGTIPAQLGNMTDLESLDLSCNQLTGEIPQELSDLTFLGFLNLSNNHLVGKIPQSRQFSTFGSSSFEGNAGLCGQQLSSLPCGAPPHAPPTDGVHVNQHRHVDVVLFLFVGLGFGVGFAAAVVVKWGQISRWFSVTSRASRT